MKDKFFSIIAHDLKNPIGSFLNLSEVMFRTFDDFSREEMKEFIEALYESSQNLFKLLDNLLTWSRAQTGKIDFNPENFNLYAIVDSNLSLFKLNAENKKIKLTNNLNPGTYVFADINMINTVIRNLVSNSLKFTNEGGEIKAHSKIHGDMLEISVTDTGIGMSEKIKNKLFRIDTHHTSVGTSNEKGTGLGLILCKEFVNRNGGDIRVESEVGKGSTFSFTVPIKHHHED
jgi:signal transduction histidine kinase